MEHSGYGDSSVGCGKCKYWFCIICLKDCAAGHHNKTQINCDVAEIQTVTKNQLFPENSS